MIDCDFHFSENVIEELTNNATDIFVASSNPTLSLLQTSSTLLNLFHNDTYRIEEPETYDDSKGDITD